MATTDDVGELRRQLQDLRAGFQAATTAIASLGETNEQLRLENVALWQRLLDEILLKAQLIDVIEAK